MRTTLIPDGSNPRTAFVIAALVFVFALSIRLAHFENEPITDELYHLLAAESWTEDGSFGIADGEYTRASLFTMLVGVAHGAGDGDVDTIRIVCIVIGSLLVAAVAWWTVSYAGATAGVIAGLLLGILPGAIFLAQYIRFYSLHALIFFLLAWCVWDLNRNFGASRRWLVLASAIVLALLGIHLQVTTLVGMAGLALWLMLDNHRTLSGLLLGARHRWIAASVVLVIVIATTFVLRDTIAALIETYYASALWNSSDTALYYFNLYRHDFGLFWSLAPAAFVIALLARPAPALFCASIFVVAFVVQSLGGMRSERFMFYALPFLFIIWAIAIDAAGRALIDQLRRGLSAFDFFEHREALLRRGSIAVVLTVGLFALATTPFVEPSVKMTLGKASEPPDYWDRYRTNWSQVAPYLIEIVGEDDVVIASQPLHAIYHLGDVDYALNATSLADIASSGTHAALDPRTGRVFFDDVASLESVIGCHRSGTIIIHGPAFGNPTRVNRQVADYIEAHLQPVSMPTTTNLKVFRWQGRDIDTDCRRHGERWIP